MTQWYLVECQHHTHCTQWSQGPILWNEGYRHVVVNYSQNIFYHGNNIYKNGPFILILVVSNIDIYIHDLFLCLRLRPVIFLTNLLILGPFSWSGYAIIKWVWEYEFVDLPRWWRYHRGKSFHKIGPRNVFLPGEVNIWQPWSRYS